MYGTLKGVRNHHKGYKLLKTLIEMLSFINSIEGKDICQNN